MPLNQLRHLALILLDVLCIQRAVRKYEIVQGSVIDDTVDKLHVVGHVTIRFDAVKATATLGMLIRHHEWLLHVALGRGQICRVA